MRNLRVQNMQASRLEDIAEILASIPDKEAFNSGLQTLLFDKLIPNWHNLDACEQMAVVGRVARWQMMVNIRQSVGAYAHRQDSEMDAE